MGAVAGLVVGLDEANHPLNDVSARESARARVPAPVGPEPRDDTENREEKTVKRDDNWPLIDIADSERVPSASSASSRDVLVSVACDVDVEGVWRSETGGSEGMDGGEADLGDGGRSLLRFSSKGWRALDRNQAGTSGTGGMSPLFTVRNG